MTETLAANQGRALSTRYALLEKLGAGGQAEVWRARDSVAGVEVALKVLNSSLAQDEAAWTALVREHAIASRLDYPAILKIQPPYREGHFVALPMELASGGDLRKLRGKGYLDVIPVLIDVAQALEYAHEHGVIHRDLKPGNILFDARGRVRIADFGIAAAPGESGTITRPGFSPFSASPEQLRGDPPSVADDIYGLGALAYELLSGYPPYYPRFEVRRALEEPVPELKSVQQMPHQLAATIMRMLSKRAQMRPRSMRDVIDDFDAALNDTLTFDFEPFKENESGPTSAMRRDAAVLAAAEARNAAAAADREAARRAREAARTGVSPPNQSRSETPPRRTAAQGDELGSPVRVTGALAKQSRGNSARTADRLPPRDHRFQSPTALRAAADPHPPSKPVDVELSAVGDELVAHHAAGPERAEAVPTEQPSTAARARQPVPEEISVVEEAPPPAQQRGSGKISVESFRIAEAAAAVRDAARHLGHGLRAEPTFWDDSRLRADPRARSYPQMKPAGQRKSWPWVVLTTLAASAAVVFVVLPKYGSLDKAIEAARGQLAAAVSGNALPAGNATGASGSADDAPSQGDANPSRGRIAREPDGTPIAAPEKSAATAASSTPLGDVPAKGAAVASASPSARATRAPPRSAEEKTGEPNPKALTQARAAFERRLDALEARGAGVWGGPELASAKMRAAESVGASDAGNPRIAQARLNEASNLLTTVESRANQTLTAQLAAGDKALASGQSDLAKQAYDLAKQIDPNNSRATDGLQRVRNLGAILPLLADGQNAEGAKDYARAVQDYSQALSLDPNNAVAKAGLNRAHAAFGDDSYAKAVGAGFAALGAGRLDEARVSFEKARTLRPSGAEAQTGLSRVGAALRARGYASTRQRGTALETEERWREAAQEYDAALQVDPSLVFAQQGRARALYRAELSENLQALIDRPERLASPAVRSEAETLIRRAAGQDPSGPVLRSQIQRLQILLPGFDVPVRLELVSDNATQVQIQRVGTFGAFKTRQIELKPGKYTVVGTRPGFRDVRRDVTIAPGGEVQTISVSCVEPI